VGTKAGGDTADELQAS